MLLKKNSLQQVVAAEATVVDAAVAVVETAATVEAVAEAADVAVTKKKSPGVTWRLYIILIKCLEKSLKVLFYRGIFYVHDNIS